MRTRALIAACACALALSPSGSAQAPAAAEREPELDAIAPQLVLGARRVQRLAPRLEAYGICDERCEFEAAARVRGVPGVGALRVVTPAKASDGGTRMRFEVSVSPRAHKLMNAALRERSRVRVVVEVAAYDLAGNESVAERSIRIARPERPLRRS